MKQKIVILGPVASGKTQLSRRLSHLLSVPVIHIDQIEFNPDLSKRRMEEIRADVQSAVSASKWILDGHGPLDLLPQHLKNAELIIFLDFPLWRNIVWLIKRQIMVKFIPRTELPKGANEWTRGHFKKMFQTLLKQHRLMNPELLRILQKPENLEKFIHVRTLEELRSIDQYLTNS